MWRQGKRRIRTPCAAFMDDIITSLQVGHGLYPDCPLVFRKSFSPFSSAMNPAHLAVERPAVPRFIKLNHLRTHWTIDKSHLHNDRHQLRHTTLDVVDYRCLKCAEGQPPSFPM